MAQNDLGVKIAIYSQLDRFQKELATIQNFGNMSEITKEQIQGEHLFEWWDLKEKAEELMLKISKTKMKLLEEIINEYKNN